MKYTENKTEEEMLSEILSDLNYFWFEKGDLERCSTFKSELTQKLLEKHRPDILKAWQDYKTALITLNNLLK